MVKGGKRLNRRILVFGFIAVLSLSVLGTDFILMTQSSPKIWYVGPTNPPTRPDFAAIQEAINNASVMAGDIIEVLENGTSPYYEHVVVNKSLIIRNYAGHQPIIDGGGTDVVVSITASNVTFSGFKIRKGMNGLCTLDNSSGNTVTSNTFSLNDLFAIYIGGLGDNFIGGNIVTTKTGGFGIFLESTNNTLKNNLITGLTCYNFGVTDAWSWSHEYVDQDIDTTNRVNGKPIYYWVNQSNRSVPSDAGYVAIINSKNITVQNLELTDNLQGLFVVNSTEITVKASNMTWNIYGIQFRKVTESTVKNVKATFCSGGIKLEWSNNNTIAFSEVSHNNIGFTLVESNYNTIIKNIVKDNNDHGIVLDSSNSSIIYHNNFVNNAEHAITINSANNEWDNGAEGNYWSGYTGLDNGYGGRIAGDGIGDTKSAPENRELDYYPLMDQWE